METIHTHGNLKYEPTTKTIRTEKGNYWVATVDSWDGMVNNDRDGAELVARWDAFEPGGIVDRMAEYLELFAANALTNNAGTRSAARAVLSELQSMRAGA